MENTIFFYAQQHRQAFENWREGEISEYWTDENGNVCIRYESGKWWHYRGTDGVVEWW